MRFIALLGIVLTAALASGCDTGTDFRIDPLIASDTVELAPPSEMWGTPSALDVTAASGFVGGGRRPEQPRDAGQWDIAVRFREGRLEFVPSSAIGIETSAAITAPMTGVSFESVVEAPGRGSFITDEGVPVQTGAVYVVQSRQIPCGYSLSVQYAKLQPLEVDPETGEMRVIVSTNGRCGDPRLVPAD